MNQRRRNSSSAQPRRATRAGRGEQIARRWAETLEPRALLTSFGDDAQYGPAASASLADAAWVSDRFSGETLELSFLDQPTLQGPRRLRADAGRWLVTLTDDALVQLNGKLGSPPAADPQAMLRQVESWLKVGAGSSAASNQNVSHLPLHVTRGLGQAGLVEVESFAAPALVESHLSGLPWVQQVDASGQVRGQTLPNDPWFPAQDHLAAIEAPAAWDQFAQQDTPVGSYDVVVGVMDTGVDLAHPDLYQNIWLNQNEIPNALRDQLTDVDADGRISIEDLNQAENAMLVTDRNVNGYIDALDLLADTRWANGVDEDLNARPDDLFGWDFINNDNNPSDDHRHGTHVAGIIGARGNNGDGGAGLNWRSSIMPLKVLDDANRGSEADVISAVNYARQLRVEQGVGVRVVNSSFVSPEFNGTLRDTIAASGQADILLVAAAGNGDIFGEGLNIDQHPQYPASYQLDNIISVTASNADSDSLASFANYGECDDTLGTSAGCSVDLAAPGVGVWSTVIADEGSHEGAQDAPAGWASRNGTSMAAPQVAGVAALLFAHQPDAGGGEVREAMFSSVRAVPALTNRVAAGGVLDAAAALDALEDAPRAVGITAPTLTQPSAEPLAITVHYRSEADGQPIDLLSLGNDDLQVRRDDFPNAEFQVQLQAVCVLVGQQCVAPGDSPVAAREIQATYAVLPPDHADIGIRDPKWLAIDDGTYQVSVTGGGVRNVAGVGNRATVLRRPDSDFAFEIDIHAPYVLFVDEPADLSWKQVEPGRRSLRSAIQGANQADQPTTIVLPPQPFTLQLAGAGEDLAELGDLDIRGDITILGAGPELTSIDAAGLDRIFDVHPGASLRLSGLTLRGGEADLGGAIRIQNSTVSIARSAVTDNLASSAGGGVWNAGSLSITESTVAANHVDSPLGLGGGGIYNQGSLHLVRTTVANNRAAGGFLTTGGGGGILLATVPGYSVDMVNVTISGNQATSGNGGGILHERGPAALLHTTIADNRASGSGGGIYSQPIASFQLANSIVAGNVAGDVPDLSASVQPLGSNLVGVAPEEWSALPSNQPGSDALWGSPDAPLDAELAPLATSTGFTATHLLLPESPAIAAGLPLTLALETDQRGLPRPGNPDSRVSLGAVEKHFVEIRGTLYHDRDGDGQRGVHEHPLDGWIVYVDANNNGSFDVGEPHTLTQQDDPATLRVDESEYVISGVDPDWADVAVRTVPRPGFDATGPIVLTPIDQPQDSDYAPLVEPTAPLAPVFLLDFSRTDGPIRDASAAELPIEIGSSVHAEPGQGPRLDNGRQLDAGRWDGTADHQNQILILDNPVLDEVSRSAGSVVTWVQVDDATDWNGILLTQCADPNVPLRCEQYNPARGIELHANQQSGVFGSVQGWNTNNFGPAHATNGGPGGSETPGGTWTHVALTWNDQGDHTIYVNGIRGRTIEGVGTQPFGLNDPHHWSIGGDNVPQPHLDANGRRLRGRLADFAIYDAELSAPAINDLIRNGVPQPVQPLVHLDFAQPAEQLVDTASDLPLRVGSLVQTAPAGGPLLSSGRQLASGVWPDVDSDDAHIDILDHPSLDAVSRAAGSIVTWVKVADDRDWNNLLKTQCVGTTEPCAAFGPTRGFELQADRTAVGGVWGAVQGWATPARGPLRMSRGPGSTETPSGVWTHVALTWNGRGDHTIYVNGVPGQRVAGVGAEVFGLNDPGDWSLGADRHSSHLPRDENGRRLHGELADFAILDGELSRQQIAQIIHQGVDGEMNRGVQTLAGFGREPSVVGGRMVFSDHLGRVQLHETDGQIKPLIGLNTVSDEQLPLTDGGRIAYDGQHVAFTGWLEQDQQLQAGQRQPAIFVVDRFGAFQELVTPDSVWPGGARFDQRTLEVHSISNSLVAFGAREPDVIDELSGRVLVRGENQLGLFAAYDPQTIAVLADRNTPVPDTGSPTQSAATFQRFGQAQLDETTFAFQGAYDGGFGIYQKIGGGPLHRVVDHQTPLPGMGTLSSIEDFAFSAGAVVFHGTSGGQAGIYHAENGAVTTLADRNTTIPGDTGTFRSFGNVAFHQGNAVFIGRGRSAAEAAQAAHSPESPTRGTHQQLGIYASLNGELQRVVDLNPAAQPAIFGGRQPVELSIGRQAISGNRVVFYAAFADGTDGIFAMDLPATSQHNVDIQPGDVIAGRDFARSPQPGQLHGQSFYDLNQNRRRDADEPGLPGWKVYLDLNDNGQWDVGEPATNTGETGAYQFTNLPTLREYVIRQVPQENWLEVAEVGDSYRQWLGASQTVTGLDFGNRSLGNVDGQGETGEIVVQVFDDQNANGKWDPGEPIAKDQELYIDLNNNGTFDTGIDLTPTFANDQYYFRNLTMTSHQVRWRRTGEDVQTTPLGNSFDVTTRSQVGERPTAVVAGDFDTDGQIDLVVGNNSTNSLTLLTNARSSLSEPVLIDHRGDGPISIVSGDWDRNGTLDLAVANFHSSDISILLGLGNGSFLPAFVYPTGEQSGPVALTVANLNGDAFPDLVVSNSSSDSITLVTNLGLGRFETSQLNGVGPQPQGIVALPAGPGKADRLAVVNRRDQSVRIFARRADGSQLGGAYEQVQRIKVGQRPTALVAGHFDSDSQLDLAVANIGDASISVLAGQAGGAFRLEQHIRLTAAPLALTAVDIDRDGDQDLVVTGNGEVPLSLLRHDGQGRFQTTAFQGAADFFDVTALPFSVTGTDINNDQIPDVILAHRDSNQISIMETRIVAGSHRVSLDTNHPQRNVQFGVQLQQQLAGDADGDRQVGFSDFLILMFHMTTPDQEGWQRADFDEDGLVDFADFLVLSANFGKRLDHD